MKKRILIIEDEASIRRLITMALETHYEVAEAFDGPSGVARFGDGRAWDAVLLDQRMPGMEGLEVLRRIKAVSTTVPVIMVTAYPSIDLAVEAMKIGAVDFLRKPVTPDILRSAVAAALAGRAAPTPAPKRADSTRPDIEMITMNGFRIVHDRSEPPATHYFHVFEGASTTGSPVVVRMTPEAMAKVGHIVGRTFEPTSPYWEILAEDYLAAFLWNDQHIPVQPLVLKDVTEDDLMAANFWPLDG